MIRPHLKRQKRSSTVFLLLFLFLLCLGASAFYFLFISVPQLTLQRFGPPAPSLSFLQRTNYSIQLLVNGNDLVNPVDIPGNEVNFKIELGETAASVANRLSQAGLIQNAETFRVYLVYAGLDTHLQAGDYLLNSGTSPLEIANHLQDATPEKVTFVILPGWRAEEIAASLPTSGLSISPEEFIAAVHSTPFGIPLKQPSADIKSLEGFFFPDSYLLPRNTSLDQLIQIILQNFDFHVTDEIVQGFAHQGLTLLQGVTLASIVQKEAMVADEQPIIASVFLNRLRKGMNLDSDPTVQYGLGYNANQKTWWTNPLSRADLQFDSVYNTYLYIGLPPGPIANPGLSALQAVAFPGETPYFYFRAKCDGSGRHNFAITLDEQTRNACP
jgi:UPF0755 protein